MYWWVWVIAPLALFFVSMTLILIMSGPDSWYAKEKRLPGDLESHYGDLEYKPSVAVVDRIELLMEAITELEAVKAVTVDDYVMTFSDEHRFSKMGLPLSNTIAYQEAQRRARNKVWNIAGLIGTDGRFETKQVESRLYKGESERVDWSRGPNHVFQESLDRVQRKRQGL